MECKIIVANSFWNLKVKHEKTQNLLKAKHDTTQTFYKYFIGFQNTKCFKLDFIIHTI